ncbi:MAG TPA: class I SAM-dependent methyltransferase [Candidatus Bathyarchaeia archaeon]|nr:class I SAM-dependent methyltransferase [Candidatus Bathyarchaeia archaeon]
MYESVSEIISLGLAGPLRRRAIARIRPARAGWTLDSGAGPGVASRMMIDNGFRKIAAVDPSRKLLEYAKIALGEEEIHPVIAVAENLPFREEVFAGAITCFSLRDVRNTDQSLREFRRILKRGSMLEIVDVGKPDSLFLRAATRVYISIVMPLLTRALISGRLRGNPFEMIIPTFRRLQTNNTLVHLVKDVFHSSTLQEFLFGSLIILEAKRLD